MAVFTKKEFADKCEIKTKDLSNYIKRGKIVLNDQDLIDDQEEANKYFVEKRKAANITASVEVGIKNERALYPRTVKINKEVPVKKEKPTAAYELDLAIKNADLQKKEVDTRLAILKEEKFKGALIPTDLVKIVFKQHSANITTSFKNGIENLLIEISKTKNLNRNELAELRGKMIGIINSSINDSVTTSKKMISSIVSQYSEKKEVGEKE